MIYTLRTTSGREEIVMDIMMTKIKNEGLDIKAIFHPAELKGYIFIEGPITDIHKAIQGMMHLKGLIDKPVNLSEIQHFMEKKKDRINIEIGDIVEIIGGPFKGERGKIDRIDNVKDEITIELLEASIPIPVTISTEFVKVVKRMERTEPKQPEPPAEEPKEEAKEEKAEEQKEEKSIFDDIKEQ